MFCPRCYHAISDKTIKISDNKEIYQCHICQITISPSTVLAYDPVEVTEKTTLLNSKQKKEKFQYIEETRQRYANQQIQTKIQTQAMLLNTYIQAWLLEHPQEDYILSQIMQETDKELGISLLIAMENKEDNKRFLELVDIFQGKIKQKDGSYMYIF